jgi:hypothetical protein
LVKGFPGREGIPARKDLEGISGATPEGAKIMYTARLIFSFVFSAIVLTGSAAAQNAAGSQQGRDGAQGAVVTASSTASGVRFVSPGQSRRVRLEVYTQAGERLFDSDFRAGNIADWDAQGIADGSYLCVVTAEDLQGASSRRLSAVNVSQGRATVRGDNEEKLRAEFAQALAAAGQSGTEALAARQKKAQALTLTTHDGQDGQVTSTTGSLTFRTGDVLSGNDREQMRVTPEGRVGVGTTDPQATLDVAGTVRAQDGIVFGDGTVLKSANDLRGASIVGVTPDATTGTPTLNASGTGTAGRISKWMDGAGTLGDSALTESGGKVGIGTTNPAYGFHLVGGSLVVEGANGVNFGNADFAVKSASGNGFWDFAVTNSNGSFVMYDAVGQKLPFTVEQGAATNTLYVNSLGRVGIGTVSPSAKLHVEGDGLVNGVLTSAGLGVDTNTLWVDSTANNVGVGTTAPKHKLQVTGGNVYISTPGAGIILRSAQSNTCVLYTASESGLVGSSTPCP